MAACSTPVAVPPLTLADVAALQRAADMDWRNIDPSIFGTLFERGLNPAKRSQLGAHYTDPATIMRLVEPVILRPLTAEWQAAKAKIATLLAKSKSRATRRTRTLPRCSSTTSNACATSACSTRPAAAATSSISRSNR
jgi:hypothetical protein